jgi:indole-3-glycerol phosphate synthase
MERAARLHSRLIGVNNRDLKRFVTDIATTERLAPLAPEGTLLVAESGINTMPISCASRPAARARSWSAKA